MISVTVSFLSTVLSESSAEKHTTVRTTRNNSKPALTSQGLLCHCGKEPVRLVTKKNNCNRGRIFYKCAKPQGKQCRFFQWDDELPESIRRIMARRSSENSATKGNELTTSTPESSGIFSRCSRCGTVGHIKTNKNCPMYPISLHTKSIIAHTKSIIAHTKSIYSAHQKNS